VTDDDLRELLTDAVADVEPAYRLDAIKARTRPGHRRRGWYAASGAILAAAAVVTAVSVVSDDNRPRREAPASDTQRTVAVYFVGRTPAGPRLYREFQQLPEAGGALAALRAITMARGPADPDYRTIWPPGIFESVTVAEDAIEIELGEWNGPRIGYSGKVLRIAVQQVVHTAQAATGEELPVRFIAAPMQGTRIAPHIDGLVERLSQNDVLALVSISDPSEGLHVNDSFIARGRANSFEGTVPWEIRAADGTVVENGFATAEGSVDRLYKWETDRITVSDLTPGTYEFVAMTDDPSGGEGRGPFTDTRTIIVD